ncbi:MAG: glycosyltransferase family 39 protein, partial [Anaerolineae bacterium]|nr:glycosyltransferase family 39 protein [Anaerolineae bacterium]
MPGSSTNRGWLIVLLLLTALFIRIHHVTALPPFNDESLHIRRAEVAWSLDDLNISLKPGKLLTYYWIGLFNADRLHGIFIGRTAVGMFSLLGLAGVYATARRLFGVWGGILALYTAVFSPFMIFFDRLAFSDPLASALGILTVWGSLLMVRHPDEWEWGILTGIFGGLTTLAKLIGAPYMAVPLLAVLLFTGRKAWKQYKTTIIVCYLTFSVILLPFFSYVVYKEISFQRAEDTTAERAVMVEPVLINTRSPLETVIDNVQDIADVNGVLHGGLLLAAAGLALVAVVRFRPRTFLFLFGCIMLPWSVVIFLAGRFSTRYVQLGVLPLLILIVGALVMAFQRLPERWKMRWVGSWLLVSLWVVFFAQPFITAAWTDPRQMTLPKTDRYEYFQNFTSGYGLMDAAAWTKSLEPSSTSGRIPVMGLVGSCHQIRLYLDEHGPVNLECPNFGWEGELMTDVARHMEQRLQQEGVLYVLAEP